MTCVSSDLEQHLVALLAKLERDAGVRDEGRPLHRVRWSMGTMFAEVRTLELWRAVIAECLACVFYVLLVCGAYSPWAGQPARPDRHVVISLVAGFSMTVLVHCFQQVSGSHINPAITLSLAVLRRVTPLRAGMYVLAQLGGGIAGAALLFGATSSGYSGELGSTVVSRVITVGQGFGVEFLLTFVVALAYFSSMCPHRTAGGVGHASVIIGMAYLAATLVGLPLTGASMNPARSLGPAFVMNSWDGHWVYWAGPILGAITAGFIHEFIFNPRRSPLSRNHSSEGGEGARGRSGGVGRRGDDAEEALSTVQLTAAGQPQQYNALRRTAAHARPGAMANINSDDLYTTESVYGYDDYIYSGSKSLYTPTAKATSLHRSQSVCTRPLPNPDMDPPHLPLQKGLLHNNLMVYNAQQLEEKQHYPQQQQQHLANNIDKPTSTGVSLSQYAKNIRNVSSPSESEFSTASTVATRGAPKSNLIKPDPIYKTQAEPIYKTRSEHVYKTQEVLSNNHNNQKHLAQQQQYRHHQQQQQQAELQQQIMLQQQHHYTNTSSGPNLTYQNAPLPSGRNSSVTERCSSVTSSRAAGLGPKYLPGEDDDASQYGDRNLNYRHHGGNRPELPTPGSSVNSENALQPYQQYRPAGNKPY